MAPAETKAFDPAALASLTTGRLLVDNFSIMAEAAEWIAGHPIWTHQYVRMRKPLAAMVLAQFPDMPGEFDGDDWQGVVAAVRARYGAAVDVRKGSGEGMQEPLGELIEMVARREETPDGTR